MTQLVMGVNEHFLLPLAHGIIAGVKKLGSFLKGFGNSFLFAVAMSRQAEANRRLAYYLKHDYPKWSEQEILAHLNEKSIKQLEEEFGRD